MDKDFLIDLMSGIMLGVSATLVIIGVNDDELITKCELNLPRTQHCEIIKTAEVVK